MKLLCFFILVLTAASAVHGQISSRRKSAFIDHLNNLLNKIVAPLNETTPASTRRPPGAGIPIARNSITARPSVSQATLNPLVAINRAQNSIMAINLMETIAPPAVRPCFVRPAFCPATSDACSRSRCARLYANGVRIGSRFYKRVKCRLNYCRETCGKAEWFADGRRLIGCSDSSSTLDQPIWSVQRVFPKPARLDSRMLPIERVANSRVPVGAGGEPFNDTAVPQGRPSNSISPAGQPQRRSVQSWIGEIADSVTNKTKELGKSLKDKFEELNSKRKDDALARAANVTADDSNGFSSNLTAFVNKQLDDVATWLGVEHDPEHQHEESTEPAHSDGQTTQAKTDLWLVLFLVAYLYK